jgi:hypothetical protein
MTLPTDIDIATAARAYVEAERVFARSTHRGAERKEMIDRKMGLFRLCAQTDDDPGVISREVTVERMAVEAAE